MCGKDPGRCLGESTIFVGQDLRKSPGRGHTVSARWMETHVVPSYVCQLGDGGLNKRPMAPPTTFLWEKATPPALALQPGNSVPLCIYLVPFTLLPQCWTSERVSPSPSMTVHWPFKRNCLCWFYESEVVGNSLPINGNLGSSAYCRAGTTHS